MKRLSFLAPAIIISKEIYLGYWAEEQRALALDGHFLDFRESTTLLLNYGSISWGAVISIIRRHASACATLRKIFSNRMRAYKARRPTKSWKVVCVSLPSM